MILIVEKLKKEKEKKGWDPNLPYSLKVPSVLHVESYC